MTKGCLNIQAKGEDRSVLLHTYHTGMDIPKWIRRAPVVTTRHKFSYVSIFVHDGRIPDKDRIKRIISADCGDDGFDYPPFVAGMVIAAFPRGLFPVPPKFVKDLSKWSGYDHPFNLIVSPDEWIVYDDDKKIDEFDPSALMLEELCLMFEEIKNRKEEIST